MVIPDALVSTASRATPAHPGLARLRERAAPQPGGPLHDRSRSSYAPTLNESAEERTVTYATDAFDADGDADIDDHLDEDPAAEPDDRLAEGIGWVMELDNAETRASERIAMVEAQAHSNMEIQAEAMANTAAAIIQTEHDEFSGRLVTMERDAEQRAYEHRQELATAEAAIDAQARVHIGQIVTQQTADLNVMHHQFREEFQAEQFAYNRTLVEQRSQYESMYSEAATATAVALKSEADYRAHAQAAFDTLKAEAQSKIDALRAEFNDAQVAIKAEAQSGVNVLRAELNGARLESQRAALRYRRLENQLSSERAVSAGLRAQAATAAGLQAQVTVLTSLSRRGSPS